MMMGNRVMDMWGLLKINTVGLGNRNTSGNLRGMYHHISSSILIYTVLHSVDLFQYTVT
jgi:hypothetical protein